MTVLVNKDGNECTILCDCKCGAGLHIDLSFCKDSRKTLDIEPEIYLSFISSNFYNEQCGHIEIFKQRCKKIWTILRGKDYTYSDIILNVKDWKDIKDFMNNVNSDDLGEK
jgi:hypothetical protein